MARKAEDAVDSISRGQQIKSQIISAKKYNTTLQKSHHHCFRPSDPMLQTCLLEVPSDDVSDIPSTSSYNSDSSPYNQQRRMMNDFYVPSMSMLGELR